MGTASRGHVRKPAFTGHLMRSIRKTRMTPEGAATQRLGSIGSQEGRLRGDQKPNDLSDPLGHLSEKRLLSMHLACAQQGRIVQPPFGIDTHRKRPARRAVPLEADLAIGFRANRRCGASQRKGLKEAIGQTIGDFGNRLRAVAIPIRLTALLGNRLKRVFDGSSSQGNRILQIVPTLGHLLLDKPSLTAYAAANPAHWKSSIVFGVIMPKKGLFFNQRISPNLEQRFSSRGSTGARVKTSRSRRRGMRSSVACAVCSVRTRLTE